jgi:hypothetical protein
MPRHRQYLSTVIFILGGVVLGWAVATLWTSRASERQQQRATLEACLQTRWASYVQLLRALALQTLRGGRATAESKPLVAALLANQAALLRLVTPPGQSTSKRSTAVEHALVQQAVLPVQLLMPNQTDDDLLARKRAFVDNAMRLADAIAAPRRSSMPLQQSFVDLADGVMQDAYLLETGRDAEETALLELLVGTRVRAVASQVTTALLGPLS